MPASLQSYLTGTNVLTPVQFPQDARNDAGVFGASLTVPAGTVLGKKTSDGKLYAYAAANSDGTQTAVGLNMYTLATDASGNVFYNGSTNASSINVPFQTSPYFVAGTFDTATLTGWDSTARTTINARVLAAGTNIVKIP